MEDPMMSSVVFSVADELAEIGVLDDPAVVDAFYSKIKKSPGHESVASGDSGYVMGSPARSEISVCESLADMIFNDFDKNKAGEKDLIDYLTSGVESGKSDDKFDAMMDIAMEDSIMCFNDEVEEEEAPKPTPNSDLNMLLERVEKQGAVANIPQPEVRNKRPVRATRGGKTVVMASGIVAPATPTTRQRVAKATANTPVAKTAANTPVAKAAVYTPAAEATPSTRRRLPQVAEEDLDLGDTDSLNKNALQARINRQKKKAYITGLESENSILSKENDGLKKERRKAEKDINNLIEEVAYLKNVIQNQSALAGMLQNVQNVQGVRFTTSFEASRKRSASELDHDYGVSAPTNPSKKRKASPPSTSSELISGGVCLHVDNGMVSLEFCAKCSKMSTGAVREEEV